jgi:opacity protein-like surface antigen
MKRSTTLAILACILGASSLQAQLSAGVGGAYGTQLKRSGVQLRLMYDFNERFQLAPDVVVFFNDDKHTRYNEYNVNLHYNFLIQERLTLHALAGLNSFTKKVTIPATPPLTEDIKLKDQSYGLNLGAGGLYRISDGISAFGEGKYSLAGFEQFLISAGIMFHF